MVTNLSRQMMNALEPAKRDIGVAKLARVQLKTNVDLHMYTVLSKALLQYTSGEL